MQVNGPMKVNGPTEVKEQTEVNFKHGGGRKIFLFPLANLSPISHFENDGITVIM